jgi:RNA polymerase sigma factor (sigma-70 family)
VTVPGEELRRTEEEANDRALMARVQGGDEAALGALMERWELPVKSVIARLVFNASEAEELAQETFVRVWQQREKFRAGAEFRPWVFAIAINLARNRLRWWRRRPNVSLEDWSREGERGDQRQETSAVALEKSERAAAVRDAIAALPAELREAIVLFEYEHLSHAEIAVIVGATPKAVETRIHRAREKLRPSLKRWL